VKKTDKKKLLTFEMYCQSATENIECELDYESNKCGNVKKIKCYREHYTVNPEEETGPVWTYL